jgi:hypothetical protein
LPQRCGDCRPAATRTKWRRAPVEFRQTAAEITEKSNAVAAFANEFEEGQSQTRSSGHALARDLRDAFPRRASQRKFAAANAQHENSVRKIGA